MKKSFVIIMLSLVFLTAFKKKELSYTDTEKELISQICKEDQACKDEINQKFKGLEFTEGELEYQRKTRKEYLKEKALFSLNEDEIGEVNEYCEEEKEEGFLYTYLYSTNDDVVITSYDACISEFTKKLLSFSGSEIHMQRRSFLRNFIQKRARASVFGRPE